MDLTILYQITLTVSILATGLVAGIFFAFSNFVMQALARLSPNEGIRAMQAINVTVLNPWFLGTFLGTGFVAIGAAAFLYFGVADDHFALMISASGLYNCGVITVTTSFNVPLNNRLEKLDAESTDAHDFWQVYLRKWLFWNHVRTIAAAAACISLVVATFI